MGKSISNEVKDSLPRLLLLFHEADCALLDDPVSLAQKRLYVSINGRRFSPEIAQSVSTLGRLKCLQ